MSPGWRRSACVALLAISACYETRATRIRVRVPTTQLNCAETTDRVFGEAGFARLGAVQGPGFFYTPRSNMALGLHWGVGQSCQTTLLGILSTLVSPSSGTVRWGDDPLGRGSPSRAHIGYVGHDPGLYVDLTARENLKFFCGLHGCDATPARVDRLLARVGLADVPEDATARTFSRGMLQRLALARALAHDPALLLFDEPSAALDPAGAAWLQTELAAERTAGRTVVLVTHDLEATAAIADQVLILRRGRVVLDTTPAGGFQADALRSAYREATGG